MSRGGCGGIEFALLKMLLLLLLKLTIVKYFSVLHTFFCKSCFANLCFFCLRFVRFASLESSHKRFFFLSNILLLLSFVAND